MTKNYYVFLFGLLLLFGVQALLAQTPVAVGSGSYASFPAPAANQNGLFDFITTKPIYVADNKKNGPIPTNDWWTDLIVSGNKAGLLWAYPLVADPEPNGVRIQFPNRFVADGSNLDRGGAITVKAQSYTAATAVAKDWSDWGLVMSLPGTSATQNIDVTMAHGVPYFWFETKGIDPELAFEKGAAYLTGTGAALTFPTTESFVIRTDGRHFGVHLDGHTTADMQGQQYALIDLGSVQDISRVKLTWEAAFASGYAIQVSTNKTNWTTLFAELQGKGGINDVTLSGQGRYVKLALTERGTIFAYSLFEMEVFNGATLLSKNKPVEVSSTQAYYNAANLTDGNLGTRWASDGTQQERLVLTTGNSPAAYFVLSALNAPTDLATYETYAHNKVTNTNMAYAYDAPAGKVTTTWAVTTTNLQGQAAGSTIQGFLPHLYANAAHNIGFSPYSYLTSRGNMKTAIGNSFSFTYNFGGMLPSYNAPYSNAQDTSPYNAQTQYSLVTQFAKKTDYGGDTYWGGKDLVNFAKYTLMAKELNHQAYASLKAKTREALVNWLTYTPGETEKYFARYDRWGALIGFNEAYGSAEFTDNHFHYGYLVLACALYATVDPDFMAQYGEMVKLVAKQYANWDKADTRFPYLRTFDPWIGHSYAGGTSSGSGNNQESTSEAMQSWIGLFLLGDMLDDKAIRDVGAFGYSSESYATLEYWFDWKKRNLPPAYGHSIVGILFNGGFAYGTYFSASPMHIHGIQYLPVNPGFSYLARDPAWAKGEYEAMMAETKAADGYRTESDFGADWANVTLGFRQLFDPAYTAAYMANNLTLPPTDPAYIMKDATAGMTYFYTHADQNLGLFSTRYHTNFPASSVFEQNGAFSHAVAYNPTVATKTCVIYDAGGAQIGSFSVPAHTLLTYPALPKTGGTPTACYNLVPTGATASSGNAMAAIDGNGGTRWESKFTDPQFLTVDLGVVSQIRTVTIAWEVANAKKYALLGSADGATWDTLAVKTNMATGNRTDVIDNLSGNYRYLQVYGTARNTPYGYSIYEVDVCGLAAGTTPPPSTPLACFNVAPVSATASSGDALAAIDGNGGTRWESQFTDPQYITLDMGRLIKLSKLTISWERANAKAYAVLGSMDNVRWDTLARKTNMPEADARIDVVDNLSGDYRYVKLYGTARTTPYGYSIYEVDVCGTPAAAETACYTILPASATASSGIAQLGIDRNPGTRWESQFTDPQYITLDMGMPVKVGQLTISWERAAAKTYAVLGSVDNVRWDTLARKTDMPLADARVDVVDNLSGNYRYLQVYGTARTTGYGYSIYELAVCGSSATTAGARIRSGEATGAMAFSQEVVPVVLFPNPVGPSGEAALQPAIAHTGYELLDVQGRVRQHVSEPGTLSRISLGSLPAGVYLLRVQTLTGSKLFRVVRQ